MKKLLRAVVGFAVFMLTLNLGMMLIFRSGSPRLLKTIRTFNNRYLNPVMLRFSGKRGFYASTIHHVGRTSGRTYATPVVVERTPGGYLIPLPYGTGVDWLANIRAAGSARLTVAGDTVAVERPEIISATEAATYLSVGLYRRLNAYGVQHYLRLRVAESVPVQTST